MHHIFPLHFNAFDTSQSLLCANAITPIMCVCQNMSLCVQVHEMLMPSRVCVCVCFVFIVLAARSLLSSSVFRAGSLPHGPTAQ